MGRLALRLGAGNLDFALAIATVVTVLPRVRLRPLVRPPHGVVGLLAFRGLLVPVVDLGLIARDRPCEPLRSTRIVVVQPGADPTRRYGLLAERVLDTIEVDATAPALRHPGAAWVGDHVTDADGSPQLVEAAALLDPDLAALIGADVDP